MGSANFKKSKMTGEDPPEDSAVTLAHLSDPHISCMDDISLRDLLGKRLFGFLRWKLHRNAEHSRQVLSALDSDLERTRPDHIAVTGDLTHLGLSTEYEKARQWLQSLGSPSRVTVIPGNHDAYVKTIWQRTMAHWTDYMVSDSPPGDDSKSDDSKNIFPSLRIRGCIALIGLSTARPSAPHLATGTIGAAQLRNLETLLARCARRQLYRIVLIHHPPAAGIVSWRKCLTDAADLRSVLDQTGAELILHGHAHRTLHNVLPTPTGNIPLMGVPSISALGRSPERRARYYIYRIKPGRNGWQVNLEVRIYSTKKGCFIRESGPGNFE